MKIDLVDNAERAVICNQISWKRLIDQLRAAGEFADFEIVARLEITPHGIRYFTITPEAEED